MEWIFKKTIDFKYIKVKHGMLVYLMHECVCVCMGLTTCLYPTKEDSSILNRKQIKSFKYREESSGDLSESKH